MFCYVSFDVVPLHVIFATLHHQFCTADIKIGKLSKTVPAVFTFGDSITDTFNNNYFPTISNNFPSYGSSFIGEWYLQLEGLAMARFYLPSLAYDKFQFYYNFFPILHIGFHRTSGIAIKPIISIAYISVIGWFFI